jgi:hypothetical protein
MTKVKKDVWDLLINEDRLYSLVFEEEVDEDEAVALFKMGTYEDILAEEVVETYSIGIVD